MVRPFAAAQSSVSLMALLRRSMPAVLVSELSSTSRSIRVTLYVVITFSNACAIWLTLVQLSAISVPPLSAAKPPNDGITSPPPARIVLMSLPKVELDTGRLESPFQTTVHEPLDAVCRKAIVRCLIPVCAASVAGLCPVQDSKQGANTRLGT